MRGRLTEGQLHDGYQRDDVADKLFREILDKKRRYFFGKTEEQVVRGNGN